MSSRESQRIRSWKAVKTLLGSNSPAANQVLNTTSVPVPPPPDFNKVAGWLTVFRVQIVWSGIGTLAKGNQDDISTLILAGILLTSGIALAQMLGNRSRHALRFVKWYLIGRIVLTSLAGLVNPSAFALVIPCLLWMLYFHRSVRVRVVFGRNLFDKAANA